MNLGIKGRNAIVCAASRGLGFACAASLVREGVNVVINGRTVDSLNEAVKKLKEINPDVTVKSVVGDISSKEIQIKILSLEPNVDILVTNADGPPVCDDIYLSLEQWMQAINTNMLTPISLIQSVVEKMSLRRFGRIVNITSGNVKAPLSELCLSNGARCGLTGYINGIAKKTNLVKNNVTINNLLPGAFDTQRLKGVFYEKSKLNGELIEETIIKRKNQIPVGRFGSPNEFGDLCAFLCIFQAGYITGQNILIDGGEYRGIF
ncbi:TPA: SDR family NAD(P)-dependent oxidoreductase [Salmonella enterica subsp. enterica serovar Newport]